MTLTRATLGTLMDREIKDDLVIMGHPVIIQKPTPLEFSQYQISLGNSKGEAELQRFPDALLLLTARMWIDDKGNRIFQDNETKQLNTISLPFYEELSETCRQFAHGRGAPEVLGESDKTTDSDLPAESVSNLE